MCGIVGYVGPRDAIETVIAGLHRLEYRGYDSAGIACLGESSSEPIFIVKTPGRVRDLERAIAGALTTEQRKPVHTAIGHTRWATHGAPNGPNAHPHASRNGKFAIVHNGIIENYADLRTTLSRAGYTFTSETDSEVIAHLVEEHYDGDLRGAVASALKHLVGTYGIAVVSSLHPGVLVAARKGSPIAVGVGDHETIIASDIGAIVNYTKQVVFLDDGDIVTATAENVDITSAGNLPVAREVTHIDWDIGQIEKDGFKHFMLKEICDQPAALRNATRGRIDPDEGMTRLSGMRLTSAEMARMKRMVIAACGTSLYAGMVGKYLFEDLADLPTDVQQAAEFRYRNPILQPDTCALAISQSGETADTLAAVREALRKGASVLGICNVVGSTIAREVGRGVYLHAGPEIGVASTKAFTCQVAVLAMMAIAFGRTRRLSAADGHRLVRQLAALPDLAEQVVALSDAIRRIAERYAGATNAFFIGRGYMYPAALEGALKLKEISYIHAEGYHAAELKHGPIALLDETVPVIAAAPNIPGKVKTIGNILECRARGAPVIGIATDGDADLLSHCSDVIFIPPCEEFLSPVPVVIAEQLFAYHVADLRGCPIDHPRNLAKSVTVE